MKLSHFFDIWLKPLFVSGPDFSTCLLHKPEKYYTQKKIDLLSCKNFTNPSSVKRSPRFVASSRQSTVTDRISHRNTFPALVLHNFFHLIRSSSFFNRMNIYTGIGSRRRWIRNSSDNISRTERSKRRVALDRKCMWETVGDTL